MKIKKHIFKANLFKKLKKKFIIQANEDNQLDNVIIYNSETFVKDWPVPKAVFFNPVPKTMGKHDQDLTDEAIETCKRHTIVMEVEN